MLRKSSLQESRASSIPQVDRSAESTVRRAPETQNQFRARPIRYRLAESQSRDTAPDSQSPANSATPESPEAQSSNTCRFASNFSFQPQVVPRQFYFPR